MAHDLYGIVPIGLLFLCCRNCFSDTKTDYDLESNTYCLYCPMKVTSMKYEKMGKEGVCSRMRTVVMKDSK